MSNRGTNPNENGTQGEMIDNFVQPQTSKHSELVAAKQALSPPIIKKNTNNIIVMERGVVERD